MNGIGLNLIWLSLLIAGSVRDREKADRATIDLVLDPRTRLMLFKMLNTGLIQEINGCISTGKEV